MSDEKNNPPEDNDSPFSTVGEDTPSAEEVAAAESLAAHIDDLLASKPMPAVAAAEERELLQLSSMVRAAHHEQALSPERQSSIIEDALAKALPVANQADFDNVHSLDRARQSRRRAWSIGISTVVAVAAVALFWLRPSPKAGSTDPETIGFVLPLNQQSRTSDELIGSIDKEHSGMASGRLDRIYSDRMGGYRALEYSRLVGKQ